ncbi:MAG: choice-of-anchor D domain-containing protein [bacterium]
MKKLILFIVIVFTIGLITNNTAKSASRPYYLLLDGIEDQMGNGEGNGFPGTNTQVTNLIDLLYWNPLTSRDLWKPFCQRVPFGPGAFAQYPITSYDFAIFLLKDKGLDHSVGGIRVIDKINEMIAAGKDVIILGNNWLRKAAGNTDANKFVTETLGLIPEQVSLIKDNTYIGFDVYGAEGVPTSGQSLHFNGGYDRNGSGIQWPIRLYRDADMFQIKPESKFKEFNRTNAFGGTKYIAGMIDIGKSTVAVYSIDWSNVAGSTTDATEYTLKSLVELFLDDTPNPEAFLKSQFERIQMGSCLTGDSLFSTCVIKNFGREPLVVTDVRLDRTEQTCFTLMNVPKTFTLEPEMQKKLMLRFKPTEDGDYVDDVFIVCNAVNANSESIFDIPVEATGGEKLNYGANLSITSYPIDFGKIMVGKVAFADVEITNTGQSNMVIDSIYFPDKNQKDFIYAGEYKMPKVVISGSSYTERMKFIPLIPDKKYTTKVRIYTNGYNDLGWGKGIGYVDLIGETYSDKAGADFVVASDEIMFGKCSGKKDTVITIRNAGDVDLLVQIPEFSLDCNTEIEAPYSFSPAEIPLIPSGGQFKLTITFNPPRDKEYSCDLKFINNSTNPSKANFSIWLNGEGVGTSVDGDNPSNTFDVYVTPNPITDNSEIKLSIFDNSQNSLEITLVDMLGKEVMNIGNGLYSKGEYKFNLNKANLASGKYLLVVKYGRTTENVSVIVK